MKLKINTHSSPRLKVGGFLRYCRKALYEDLVGMLSITEIMMRRGRKSIKRVFRLRVREIQTGRVSEFSKFKIVAEKPEVNSIIPFHIRIKSED